MAEVVAFIKALESEKVKMMVFAMINILFTF